VRDRKVLSVASGVTFLTVLGVWFGVPFLLGTGFGIAFAAITLLALVILIIAICLAVVAFSLTLVVSRSEWGALCVFCFVLLAAVLVGFFWAGPALSGPLYALVRMF
jgi:hypothetical protein